MSNTLLLLLLPFLLSVNGCSSTTHHTGWSAFGLVGSSFTFHAQSGPPSLQQQLRSILKGYTKGVRPVRDWRRASVVTLDLTVQAVLDVVEKQEKVVLFIEVRQRWRDEYLHWHPAQFQGVHSFSVPVESIWVPDITIFEKAEEDKFSPGKFVYVSHDGQVELLRMQLLSSMCPLNFYNFPLDAQTCNLTFGVLAHNNSQVQVKIGNQLKVSNSRQAISSLKGEWELLSIQEVDVHFERCSAIRVQVTVRRRALFYIVNLIVPSALLMLLDVMGFLLPPSNKQRLTYKATTFIGYFIFILMVFTLFPPFMGPLPLIEVYLIGSLGLLVLSNLQTVAMFRLSNGRSPWTQKYFSAFLLERCDGYKREQTKGEDSEVKFLTCGSDTSEEKLERSRLLKMNEEVKTMKKQLQSLRMEQEFLSRCREFGSMLDQIYLYLHVSTLILSATVLYIIWPYKT